jgi:hypothetical protein
LEEVYLVNCTLNVKMNLKFGDRFESCPQQV